MNVILQPLKPWSCCESSLTISQRMPCAMESESSSINALYSVMLFVDLPIHTPLKLTKSSLRSKMAQVAKDRFHELRLALSAYPTHDSDGFDICNKCKSGLLDQNKDFSKNKNITKADRLLY